MHDSAEVSLTFDAIEVGRVYAERTFTVSADTIAAYCRAVGATAPLYERGTPAERRFGGPIAPPTLLAMWTPPRVSFPAGTVPPGGIHTAQEWQSLHPVRPGEVLSERILVAEKFMHRGQAYVVFATTFENAAGIVVSRGRMTILWPS